MTSPSARVDRAARLVAAPADAVFAAWMSADAVQRWLPPTGARMEVELFEPRPGGALRFRLVFDAPAPGTGKFGRDSDRVLARFLSLDPPRGLSLEVRFDSADPVFAGTMRMDWTFRPQPDGTLVEVAASGVPAGIPPEAHR